MKIVDLHCDTISSIQKNGQSLYDNDCHFDIKRAQKAGIGLQFFAMFTMPQGMNELRQILKQIEKYHTELYQCQEYLHPVYTYEDIITADSIGKVAGILHLEGAEALGSDSEILSLLYRMGLRSLGLTWNNRNLLADGVGEEPNAGGISSKGKEIIYLMEKMGILLDLSHISVKSYYDALNIYNKPVLVTHANARALCNHRRNLDDSQLKALAENGGVIGINQIPEFIKEDGKPQLNDLLDHIVYISELIGIEHVALGSDFDGDDVLLMAGVEEYIRWPQLLADRGFTHAETNMILTKNALRVIKAVL